MSLRTDADRRRDLEMLRRALRRLERALERADDVGRVPLLLQAADLNRAIKDTEERLNLVTEVRNE